MSIKILLADDQKFVRDGLRSLLAGEKDMEVVAEADNGRDAAALARQHAPDIVVMDINMPDLNGIDATKIILEENSGIKVIALSIHSTSRFVREMLNAGASGYLVKHSIFEELAHAIRRVIKNRPYFSSQISDLNSQTMGRVTDDDMTNFSSS